MSSSILVLNPNSSKSVTQGLQEALPKESWPSGVTLNFRTGPSNAPPSINDAPTSIESAWANYVDLLGTSAVTTSTDGANAQQQQHNDGTVQTPSLPQYDAILVCCFSDHPLVGMLRHAYASTVSSKPPPPIMHILESSVYAALTAAQGRSFGILTTGAAMVRDINAGVAVLLGTSLCQRYAGCRATGLGVTEMRTTIDSERKRVSQTIQRTAASLALQDANVIDALGAVIIGCAGMAGFEPDIRAGLVQALGQQAGSRVAIVDGTRAGIEILAGQLRAGYHSV